MHYTLLVIGPDVEGQMSRYDENREVAPYEAPCDWCDGDDKYQPCEECGNTGRMMSTRNPEGRWDWYRIGGRWPNRLVTLDGRRVDQCTRGELDVAATLDSLGFGVEYENGRVGSGTYALLVEGAWRSSQVYHPERTYPEAAFTADEGYPMLWRSMIENAAPGLLLTLVDYHN